MDSDVSWRRRPTESFPVPARGAIRFFRRMSRARDIFRQIGLRSLFVRDILHGLLEPGTWLGEMIYQMRAIGVDSVPLTLLVAAFIGAVISVQTRYQLFAGVQLSVVGLATRQTIILEMGPLLTGLVLAGRVGARITAEIRTMRVTEQIDALEALALGAVLMLPGLVILADAIGVYSGFVVGITATDITSQDFKEGLRLSFSNFQVFYSLLKGTMLGG